MRFFLLLHLFISFFHYADAQEYIPFAIGEKEALQRSFNDLISALQQGDEKYIRSNSSDEILCAVCEINRDKNKPFKGNNVPIDKIINQYDDVLPVKLISTAIAEKRVQFFIKADNEKQHYFVLVHTCKSKIEHENLHHEFWFKKIGSKFLLEGISTIP